MITVGISYFGPARLPVDPSAADAVILHGYFRSVALINLGWVEHSAHYTGGFPVLVMHNPPTDAVVYVTDVRVVGNVRGRRAHMIRPRFRPGPRGGRGKRGKLVFKRNFTPKTLLNVVPSRPGGKFGRTVVRGPVHHPGNKPRNTDRAIAAVVQHQITQLFQSLIASAF